MQEFLQRIRDQFFKLRKEQRIFLIAIVGVIFFTFLMMLAWSGKTEWAPLFKQMDTKSAGKVLAKLKELPYKYKLTDNGATIMVPVQDKAAITLELANQNALPESSSGYKEIFESSSFMTETREREKLNFLRGLQGELETTIKHIEQIEQVRVHIVVPEKRLFEEEQENPTASVVVKMRPFTELTQDQIKGIQNLIAYAVEALEPKNVMIMDNFGRPISDDIIYEDSDEGKTTVAMKLQKQKERELQNKAQTMLERVLGPGKAVVRVDVELNFDKSELKSTEYQPPIPGEDTGIKRSEESEKEQYKGVGVVPGGVPGVDTNIPGYKGVNEENTDYKRDRLISNFEINTTEKKEIRAPGGIRHLSVSVIVDAKLEQLQLDSLTQNVKTAVGFVESRDSIQFTQMNFSNAMVDEAFRSWESAQRMRLMVTIGVLFGLLFLVLIVFIYLWWAKRREEARLLDNAEDEEIIEIGEDLGDTMSIEEQERKQMEDKIRDFARKNPTEMGTLLRLWMMEE